MSNAERRALLNGDKLVLPRVSDIYAAMPGITGKLELEYEGEMRGADTVVRELIRAAVGKIFDRYFAGANTQQIEQWFNLGGTVKLDETQPAAASLKELKEIQGLLEKAVAAGSEGERCGAESGGRGGVSAGGNGGASQAEPQRRAWLCSAGESAETRSGDATGSPGPQPGTDDWRRSTRIGSAARRKRRGGGLN